MFRKVRKSKVSYLIVRKSQQVPRAHMLYMSYCALLWGGWITKPPSSGEIEVKEGKPEEEEEAYSSSGLLEKRWGCLPLLPIPP